VSKIRAEPSTKLGGLLNELCDKRHIYQGVFMELHFNIRNVFLSTKKTAFLIEEKHNLNELDG
jgi:hypothetical protein